MARHLGRVAAMAGAAVVAALVLGQVVSARGGDRGARIALFLVLLVGAFALLAAAVVDSEHGVEKISASPRWSLRAAIKRRVRRVLAFLGRFVRRVVAIVHYLIGRSARGSRAGIARLRESLTPERRKEKWNALKQVGRTTLVALGLPPEDEARTPNEGLDAMPTLPRERSRPPGVSHHARRNNVGPLRKAFRPSAGGWRAAGPRRATESRVRSSSGG